MEDINKQHVQLPNDMTLDVKPKDLLVYVTIKRYMNKDTKKAFPALTTISAKSGASINTIRDCIKRLEEYNYIQIEKKGRKNVYIFTSYKNFEPFSYEFLDKEDLSFEEKSYIIASQQYMYKDVPGEGKISFTNKELATKINLSEASISRNNNSLEKKGYLTKVKEMVRDLETGCKKELKIFDLNKMMQQIVWVLQNHEERITDNTARIEKLESIVQSCLKENELLKKENAELKAKENIDYTI